jgi:hypothetical protein
MNQLFVRMCVYATSFESCLLFFIVPCICIQIGSTIFLFGMNVATMYFEHSVWFMFVKYLFTKQFIKNKKSIAFRSPV